MWYFDELTESGNRKTFKRQKGLNVKRSFPRCPRPWPFVPLNLSNSLIQCHNLLLLGDTHIYLCVAHSKAERDNFGPNQTSNVALSAINCISFLDRCCKIHLHAFLRPPPPPPADCSHTPSLWPLRIRRNTVDHI